MLKKIFIWWYVFGEDYGIYYVLLSLKNNNYFNYIGFYGGLGKN